MCFNDTFCFSVGNFLIWRLYVLTQCDNSFMKENLELIRELTNEMMDSISYADKITSLTDIEFMVGNEEGMTIEQTLRSGYRIGTRGRPLRYTRVIPKVPVIRERDRNQ